MIKHSKQRDCILAYMMSTKEHPTADTVYTHVKQEMPHISLATVYRNLALLVEMGKIQKLVDVDGSVRYDASMEPHDHFQCQICGRVLDIPTEAYEDIDRKAEAGFKGIIKEHSIMFRGICEDCLANEKAE